MSDDVTKAELDERARELDISGRSSMNKDELAAAIKEAEASQAPKATNSDERTVSEEERAELDRRQALREENERRQVRLGHK